MWVQSLASSEDVVIEMLFSGPVKNAEENTAKLIVLNISEIHTLNVHAIKQIALFQMQMNFLDVTVSTSSTKMKSIKGSNFVP